MIPLISPEYLASRKAAISSGSLLLLGASLGIFLLILAASMIAYNLTRTQIARLQLNQLPQLLVLDHHRNGAKHGPRFIHRLLPFQAGH